MKKLKTKTALVPRNLEEIRKDYSNVAGRYADTKYQAQYYMDESKRLYAELRVLNEEAGLRNKLDADAKEEAKKEAPSAE